MSSDDDIEIKNGDITALPIESSLTQDDKRFKVVSNRRVSYEENTGLKVRNWFDLPHRIAIPRCMAEGCDEQPLVPRVQETDDPNSYTLGYLCQVCNNFYVATREIDLQQWFFCCIVHHARETMVLPKEVKTLEEAVDVAGKLEKGDEE